MYKIVKYKTESGNCPYDNYIEELAKSSDNLLQITKIEYYLNMLEEYGFKLKEKINNAIKQVDEKNKIYELRPNKTRILYFFKNERQEYVLLHAFTKKSKKTPKEEIEKAIREKKDYIRRN